MGSFVLNAEDRYFKEVYLPNVSKYKGGLIFSYQARYNYDIEITIVIDLEGNFVEGSVDHLIKEWEYDIHEATKIGGFEDNDKEFRSLILLSASAVGENIDKIKAVLAAPPTLECEGEKYRDFEFLNEIFKSQECFKCHQVYAEPLGEFCPNCLTHL